MHVKQYMAIRNTRLGRALKLDLLFGRGMRAGRLGEGGGENKRWLKLKRDDVEERGPRSWALYEMARRRFILGGATMTLP